MNKACGLCKDETPLGFDIAMAFQPILDIDTMQIHAYEALVRNPEGGGGAGEVLAKVTSDNQYKFDQACRSKAISSASRLGVDCFLSINFMPNAVYEPNRCLGSTLKAAEKYHFPVNKIVFEFTEGEQYQDVGHIKNIVESYKAKNFGTAIDDFGAGFSGLSLAAEVNANIWKVDISLISDIDLHFKKQVIVKGIIEMANTLGVTIVAEGVETEAEFITLAKMGISRYQGYFFARPALESLPNVDFVKLEKILRDCK